MELRELRTDYTADTLDEGEALSDPFAQLERWLEDADRAGVPEPHACGLSTVAADGTPSSRNLLLRGLGPDGLVFYTNRRSQKGLELAATPRAAGLFSWLGLQRQVRVVGSVEQTSDAESDAYWATRPRGSQIGSWVSTQSRVIADRSALEAAWQEASERFGDSAPVPRPPHWGGYRLVPAVWEFWQGREHRLHDRLRYRVGPRGGWVVERLAP